MALSILVGIAVGAIAVQGLHAQSKPTAYVVAEIDVADQDGYAKEYQSRSVKPILEEGGGKFLSRGGNVISIKGEPPKRIEITPMSTALPSLMMKTMGWMSSHFFNRPHEPV
jgi:hypothetical protein